MSVGTIGGDVFLWDVGARKKISEKCFDVWKLDACSKELQVYLSPFGYILLLSGSLMHVLILLNLWTGIFEY